MRLRGGVTIGPGVPVGWNDASAHSLKQCLMRRTAGDKNRARASRANALRACTATQVHAIVTFLRDRLLQKLTNHPVKAHLFHIVASSTPENIGPPPCAPCRSHRSPQYLRCK